MTRYAILSDIHANYHALSAVDSEVRKIRAADRENPISYLFLGDLIGYGPNPIDCVRWLKATAKIGERWVPGNHDEWLIIPSTVSDEAEASLSQHRRQLERPENAGVYEWFSEGVRQAIQDEARSLLSLDFDALIALFVHASIWREARRLTYVFPWKRNILEDEMKRLQDFVGQENRPVVSFCGHTHFPMWAAQDQNEGGVVFQSIRYDTPLPLKHSLNIINPGSVGQPRDGDRRAAYAILDPEACTVEFRRVEYAYWEVASEMRSHRYPDSLIERLELADGRAELQRYQEVYQRPKWDLEAV